MARIAFPISMSFSSGFFAEITDVDHDGIERGDIDTSSMATVNSTMTWIPEALMDAGAVTIGFFFEPNTSFLVPMLAQPGTVTLTWPIKTGQTIAANMVLTNGYMNKFRWGGKVKGAMTATATLKAGGQIALNAGS